MQVRLYLDTPLAPGPVDLGPDQAHYLRSVLRLGPGDAVRLFNGRDGEWAGAVEALAKNRATVAVDERLRGQEDEVPGPWLAFAPLKKDTTDYLVGKATELGAARLLPVFTRRTAATRVNTRRLRANAIEAAEQSRRLSVPEVAEPVALKDLLRSWPQDRRLLVPDETGGGPPITDALANGGAAAALIGPEGGFDPSELDEMAKLPFVTRVGLGPRILRAETAAVAVLACLQALAGDWRESPRS